MTGFPKEKASKVTKLKLSLKLGIITISELGYSIFSSSSGVLNPLNSTLFITSFKWYLIKCSIPLPGTSFPTMESLRFWNSEAILGKIFANVTTPFSSANLPTYIKITSLPFLIFECNFEPKFVKNW